MPRVLIFMFGILGALAGCVDFPDLDDAIERRGAIAGFPELVPIDSLLLQASLDTVDEDARSALLLARVAQLRARARALNRPIIDRRTRSEMAAALRRNTP